MANDERVEIARQLYESELRRMVNNPLIPAIIRECFVPSEQELTFFEFAAKIYPGSDEYLDY